MKHIVITSIFNPTRAIEEFAKIEGCKLIVVGDKKTPEGWSYPNVEYLSVENQVETGFELSKVMPYNHYCRKMIGYLFAIQNQATFIIDTDDDNIPKSNWAFPSSSDQYLSTDDDLGFINIYKYYTSSKIWPRGLPLKLINESVDFESNLRNKKNEKVGVWQGLADLDPDVDAIYRLTSDTPCTFNERAPIVLGSGTITPFNSQNTMVVKDLFPLLYLPTYVTFRFTDILRGIIAQPIMWKHGYRLGFTNATVIQERNPHDYFKDFISEIPMYLHVEDVVEIVNKVVNCNISVADNLYNSYEALLGKNIVKKEELICLEAWLSDLNKLHKSHFVNSNSH